MKNAYLILNVVVVSFLVMISHAQTGSNTSPESTGTVNGAGVNINDPIKDSRGRMKAPKPVNNKKSKKSLEAVTTSTAQECTSTDTVCLEQKRKNETK